jgi:hypothetical protein
MEDMDCNGGGHPVIKGGESYLYANYIIKLPSIKLINNRYVARESSCPVTAIGGESPTSVSVHADFVEMTVSVHDETKARKPVDNKIITI